MARPDPVPAPIYVRYVGEGDLYQARYTIGPYRAMTEVEHGTPAAVPAETAELLLATGLFETVDEVDAITEILEADRRRAEEEAAWKRQQAEIQAAKAQQHALRELAAAKAQAVREAATQAVRDGLDRGEVVAAAAHAEVAFDIAIEAFADPGGEEE